MTTSLPTFLHFHFREGCGRYDRSHIPAAKILRNPWTGIWPPYPPIPTPLKIPKFAGRAETSADGVRHRNLHGDFSHGVGQWNWTFLSGQPSDDCSITSRVKGKGQRRSGVLWKVQGSQVSPLGCSQSGLGAALLAPPRLSCCTWKTQCSLPHVLLGVCVCTTCPGQWCAQALMHGRAHAAHVNTRHAAHYPCLICTNLYRYHGLKLSSLVVFHR